MTTVDKNKNVCTFNDDTITNTSSVATASANMFLLALNNAGSAQYFLNAKLYSCDIYDNDVLVRDFVPCKNPSGVIGLYDVVNGVFYQNAGTGEFTAQ